MIARHVLRGLVLVAGCGSTGSLAPDAPGGPPPGTDVGGALAAPPEAPLDADLSAGEAHTCLRIDADPIYCFGNNVMGEVSGGRCGAGEVVTEPWPLELRGVRTLQCSVGKCCAIDMNGIACWGAHFNGELDGLGEAAGLMRVPGVRPDDALFVGYTGSCVIGAAGVARCWGSLRDGNLRPPAAALAVEDFAKPVTMGEIDTVQDLTQIATGDAHGCGRHRDGSVSCWGNNRFGQLGGGFQPYMDSIHWPVAPPKKVPELAGVADIVASRQATCVVHDNGEVRCWGRNHDEALIPGPPQPPREPAVTAAAQIAEESKELAPALVAGLPPIRRLALGDFHACAVDRQGGVWCWGQNERGQLGDGTTDLRRAPVRVAGLPPVARIAVGRLWHSCALTTDRRVWCWGSNEHGELGRPPGELRQSATPVEIQLPSPAVYPPFQLGCF